ncbi:hypothetical protein OPT61_g1476 [Boeremia exigua]|uniref:Uncharacterized protein n=1 Tax=Boeremia exigua TaxID=749465 RepID=A0ACC2IQE1_9PLEO|nr:hypothetical protein OPT61_g1476 [Boeremia exigua]
MSSSNHTVTEMGKDKTFEHDVDNRAASEHALHTPKTSVCEGSSQKPLQSLDTASALSPPAFLPTSPVQGTKLPACRRIPVRPSDVVLASKSTSPASSSSMSPSPASSLSAYVPSSGTGNRTKMEPVVYIPTSSSPLHVRVSSVAESMVKDFKYDPNDQTPPKRKPVVIPDTMDVSAIDIAQREQALPLMTEQFVQVTPASRLHAARLALISQAANPDSQANALRTYGQGESGEPAEHNTAELAATKGSKAVLIESIKQDSKVSSAEMDSIRRLRYADAKHQDPLMIEDRFEASDLETRLQDLGAGYRRLSIVSERSNNASEGKVHEMVELDSISYNTLSSREQDNSEACGSTHPGPKTASNIPLRILSSQHASRSTCDLQGQVAEYTSSGPSLRTRVPDPQRHIKDSMAIAEDGLHVCGTSTILPSPSGASAIPGIPENALCMNSERAMGVGRYFPTPTPIQEASLGMQRDARCFQKAPVSPNRGTGSKGVTNATLQDTAMAPGVSNEDKRQMPTGPHCLIQSAQKQVREKERAPSNSMTRHAIHRWRMVAVIVSSLIYLGFLASSLYTLATTSTFDTQFNDRLVFFTKTVTSDDGLSNLTISWSKDHAASFNVTYLINSTLDPEEPVPDSWSFLLDWDAEAAGLETGTSGNAVRGMPVLSFGQVFIQFMALFGVFAIGCVSFRFLLELMSRRWHHREDESVHRTSRWLRVYDRAREWIVFILSAIVSAVLWTAVTRALLSM